MGCNESFVHFSDSYLDVLPENLGAVSHEHEQRFRQDISTVAKRYQDTWIRYKLVDYC